jgi:cation diffusion facilitator family transporter
MRKLLVRLFIKDYMNYTDPAVRTAYGKLSGVVGIISNIFLSVIKLITGFLVASVSIMADGINNLSDAASSIITLIGFKMSSLPPDKDHPYGHQRLEYITGMVVSFIILVVGGVLLKTSIEKIIRPEAMETSPAIFIILGVSMLIKFWQSRFYRTNGKLINSQALMSTSVDSLNDVIATFAVLVSLLVFEFAQVNIDGYIGVLVSLFIIFSGIKLLKETVSPLIGEAPSQEFIEKITKEILSYPGVLGIHDLVIHSYGPAKTFITVHVEVDCRVDVVVSHDVIDNIEHDFLEKYNINLVIHMDPIDTVNEETLKLRDFVRDVLETIDPVLGFHDFRVVHGPTHANIIFDVVMPINFPKTAEALKAEITAKIKAKNKKYNPVITIDRDYS